MAAKTSLKIAQSEKYEEDDWWSWSVWIEGSETDLDEIKNVEYTLHPTFRDPVRTVATRRNKFKLASGGWGIFPIYARVLKKDGSTFRLNHQLQLRYPDGKPSVE
jgi:transcription initiation factor IIF auxiliary subunit